MDNNQVGKIRISDDLCVYDADMGKLSRFKSVIKKVSIGGEISRREFVRLTGDDAAFRRKPIPAPVWADLVTGTIYNRNGSSGSHRCFLVGGEHE